MPCVYLVRRLRVAHKLRLPEAIHITTRLLQCYPNHANLTMIPTLTVTLTLSPAHKP